MTLTSNLGPTFVLAPDAIRRMETGAETELALDQIVRVRAMTVGGGGVLELVAADGRKLVVVSSRELGRGSPRLTEPARSEYHGFVRELHRHLVATGRPVEYLGGLIFKKRYDPLAIPDNVMP